MKWKTIGWHLLISGFVGLLMFFLCIWAVWVEWGSTFYDNHMLSGLTSQSLKDASEAVEKYVKENGIPPPNLKVLDLPRTEVHSYTVPPLTDGWHYPLVYTVDGSTWTITSYGADGKPGGTRVEEDRAITGGPGMERAWVEREVTTPTLAVSETPLQPTFEQFYKTVPRTRGAIKACVLAAFITACLTYASLHVAKKNTKSVLIAIGRILLTLLFAWQFALFIASMHIPTGH